MRALMCESYGPPESLRLRDDLAVPEPAAGEILIRTHFAGVNFPESLIIENKYQIKPPMPFAPGGELAGVVEKVGEGVAEFKPGDRVMVDADLASGALVLATADATVVAERAGRRDARSRSNEGPETPVSPLDLPPTRTKRDGELVN